MPLPCAHARKTLVKVLKYMYIVLDGDNRVARRTASQDGTSRSTVAPASSRADVDPSRTACMDVVSSLVWPSALPVSAQRFVDAAASAARCGIARLTEEGSDELDGRVPSWTESRVGVRRRVVRSPRDFRTSLAQQASCLLPALVAHLLIPCAAANECTQIGCRSVGHIASSTGQQPAVEHNEMEISALWRGTRAAQVVQGGFGCDGRPH